MQPGWQPKPGDIIVRRPRQAEIGPVHIRVERRAVPVRGPASPMFLVYGFLGIGAIGTALLLLPISHHGAGFTPFLDAMFTAVSAVTVTGLIVVDTGVYWTGFGQAVLLVLSFIGGLGFMTAAAFLLIIVGQRIGLQSQLAIREGLGVRDLGGLPALIRRIVILALTLQVIGAILLFLRFYVFGSLWDGISLGTALWHSVFLAVSAFNNAGLSILPSDLVGGESLVGFRDDLLVLGIVGVLILLGGLGYLVIFDVLLIRRPRRFSLETKIVLIASAILVALGATLIFILERDNDAIAEDRSLGDRTVEAVFHSVAARTAGFAIVDHADKRRSTHLVTEVLMFVGGASASTAGGIKINTFAVIVLAVVATIRGRRHVASFGREIPDALIRRALVIGAVVTAVLVAFVVVLTAVEDQPLSDLLFETVSAIGTVGLTTGATAALSDPGRVVIATAMFVGRFGPLTLALLMTGREAPRAYRYATERVRIG